MKTVGLVRWRHDERSAQKSPSGAIGAKHGMQVSEGVEPTTGRQIGLRMLFAYEVVAADQLPECHPLSKRADDASHRLVELAWRERLGLTRKNIRQCTQC